jgi:hypothetical protein
VNHTSTPISMPAMGTDPSPLPVLVQRLDWADAEYGRLRAALANGETISAQHVVIAVGFKYFKHLPPELIERLPAGRYLHTCDLVDFRHLEGKHCRYL